MKFTYALTNAERQPDDQVRLVVEVEGPYTEALRILDAARQERDLIDREAADSMLAALKGRMR
ncbi:hypothetical protein KIW74_gp47 [Mycobacterium phage Kimona]|uniref:Uncharacterized protein n=1 Tax=Mycobacterium phage Kimona TaxID=2024295 RepID=A0A249XU32_9CAUD|nr:hypothetical protein KIW74_gp47 [Mycobacterium phage Kimona]ASZ75481.1 hypothetical protein PBI_KIMONA_45 [Mycobacterium phage Kimona]